MDSSEFLWVSRDSLSKDSLRIPRDSKKDHPSELSAEHPSPGLTNSCPIVSHGIFIHFGLQRSHLNAASCIRGLESLGSPKNLIASLGLPNVPFWNLRKGIP